MEKQLTSNVLSFQIADPIERAKAWIAEQEQAKALLQEKVDIIEELSPFAKIARERMDTTGIVSITDVTKSFNLKRGQITCWAKLQGYINKKITEVNQKGEDFFKTIVDTQGHKGIGIRENGISLIDKNIEEIKETPCKFSANLITG